MLLVVADRLCSSSWKMIVKKGIPDDKYLHHKEALDMGVSASAGVGKNVGKRGASLPDDEACADEEDDEDEILHWRLLTSCRPGTTNKGFTDKASSSF